MVLNRQSLKRVLSGVSLSVMMIAGGSLRAETLEEALAYTYVANPSVLAQRAYVRSVYEKITQSQSGYKPTISGEASYGYQYNRLHARPNFVETEDKPYNLGANAVQPLFSGFETMSSVKAAREQFEAERANLKNIEQQTLMNAVVAYTDVIRALAVLKLNQNNEAVLQRQLEYTKDRFRVGELTKTDVAQSEARLAGAVAARIEAEGSLKVAYASYRKVIGKMPEKIYEPEVPAAKLPQTLNDALELAEKRNPVLQAAELSAKSAMSSVDVAKAGYYPTVELRGSYAHSKAKAQFDDIILNGKTDNSNVMLVMDVPLYMAGNVASRVRETKHLAGQARINVDTTRRDVIRATTEAWENYQSAVAGLASLEEQVKASELALEGVKYEEQAGERTILDVLNAEQELLDARVSVVTAKKNQVVASYQLIAAMGMMTPSGLGLDVARYQKKKETPAVVKTEDPAPATGDVPEENAPFGGDGREEETSGNGENGAEESAQS